MLQLLLLRAPWQQESRPWLSVQPHRLQMKQVGAQQAPMEGLLRTNAKPSLTQSLL